MSNIRLGTSGYSFGDWKGEVYPKNIKDSEMFDYYLNQFRLNTVEINYTFYSMPCPPVFEFYARRVPDYFDFAIKLYNELTHKPCLTNQPDMPDKDLCLRFLAGIQPLTESGKLGCLLAQFPPHLKPSLKAWDYLKALRDELGSNKLVYEFRNKAWVSDHAITTLKREGIGFCAVDCPQVGPLMPLVPAVTSKIAYLRLHGRNMNWFKDKSVRYDYFYSEEELKKLLPIVNRMASMSSTVYIQFNNCHAGAALRNVKMMQYLLGLDVPPIQGVLF